MLSSGWPLLRHCKIPRHFPDNMRHSCPRWVVGTRSMPVLLVLMSRIRIWTSSWLHYATNDKINMYISSYVQFLYEMLLNTCIHTSMQLATTSFWYLFPWQGLFPDTSLIVSKFPDISRFSRQVVTLYHNQEALEFVTACATRRRLWQCQTCLDT